MMLRKAKAQGKPYDIALIDTKIPGMHSVELARAISGDAEIQGTRLIMLNALAAREMPEAARAAGVADYLNKPVRRAELFQSIAGAMGAAQIETVPSRSEKEDAPLAAHVLLVEDNSVNQEICVQMLVNLGCDVEVVEDGRAGLEAAFGRRYDVVLMDCQMPVMDGFEASAAIRARELATGGAAPRRMPIVALTANAMAGDRERCLAAGMDDYLSKPFNKDALRAVLERVLRGATHKGAAPLAQTCEASAVDAKPELRTASGDSAAKIPAEAAVIDQKALDNIRKLQKPGAPNILDKIINLFFQDGVRQIVSMRDAVAAGDTNILKRAAHTLKSNSANLGALELAESCKEMEVQAGAAHLTNAEAVITRIELEYARVCDALAGQRAQA
jgi:CheY-like chemotaxis protein/HPt (histidine-containing phosphotransfer) domain-containing protein